MRMSWNRILSASIAVIYIVTAFAAIGLQGTFTVFGFVILPLACIWFGDLMGGYTGPTSGMAITSPSPGLMVCIAGWVLLLLPVIVMIFEAV